MQTSHVAAELHEHRQESWKGCGAAVGRRQSVGRHLTAQRRCTERTNALVPKSMLLDTCLREVPPYAARDRRARVNLR